MQQSDKRNRNWNRDRVASESLKGNGESGRVYGALDGRHVGPVVGAVAL